MSEPIVILYKSNLCHHCGSLSEIWDKPMKDGSDNIVDSMKKIYPKIRFFVVTSKDNSGKFDENTAPKDLKRFGKWYPMILLVPGKIWDNAMSKLGPKSEAVITDGVQIMNGTLKNGIPELHQKYDTRKPSEFAKWLKDSLENEDFKKYQTQVINPIIVPTIERPAVQPFFKPSGSNVNYTGTSSLDIKQEICSMRIVSRQR